MGNILSNTLETYLSDIKLVLLFAIPFIISFLIPLLTPLPSYVDSGAIFLRSASISFNLNLISIAIIILSVFFSLLFLSFAFVAISLIVKARKTHTKPTQVVMRGIEKYTSRVFAVLLFYLLVLALASTLGYYLGIETALTAVTGFVVFMLIFYAPTAIVIDGKGIGPALKNSVGMIAKAPQYFLMWLVSLVIMLSFLDFLFIALLGTPFAGYLLLFVNSLFVLPYFVIYQAEAYMKKYPILKH